MGKVKAMYEDAQMLELDNDGIYRDRGDYKEQAIADLADISEQLGFIGTIRQSAGGAIHMVIDNYWSIVYKHSIAKFNIFAGYRSSTNRLVKRVATVTDVVSVMRRELDKMEQTRQEFRA